MSFVVENSKNGYVVKEYGRQLRRVLNRNFSIAPEDDEPELPMLRMKYMIDDYMEEEISDPQ